MSYHSRIRHAFENAPVFSLNNQSHYVLFSDCHRGNGSSNDNLLKNQNLYFTALRHYYDRGFVYVELGDGDELWENRKMSQIIELHSNIFWLLSLFHKQNRLIMLYGNHDMEKKKRNYSDTVCGTYYCTESQCMEPLFPGLKFYEGILLENSCSGLRLYLTHGHQADFFNSTCWKLTRFLVRYFWGSLERFGVLDPTSAAKNYVHKDRIEQRLSSYASEHELMLITGHTHRPRLHASSPYYMNTGSCVHPYGITCIEIEGNKISLVKWALSVRCDQTLFVERTVLSDYLMMSKYSSSPYAPCQKKQC